ncbi:MAG: FKBP-type peptidyl-prolyl cis-trans isomerase FkpA [Oceanicoccus sp.]|jgi:FKBP-type peptidyl-prolyl cis-trans isomerase FkpA
MSHKLMSLMLLSLLALLPACNSEEPDVTEIDFTTENTIIEETTNPSELMTVDELLIEDITVGEGAEAVAGKTITVHYVGTLTDGTQFDSSRDRGMPFEFNLGAGQVIAGWDQGFEGMKIGGLRKLTIPSDLAYGDNGIGGTIPGGATLVFEVELISVD